MRAILTLIITGFVVFCGFLVVEPGIDSHSLDPSALLRAGFARDRFRGNDKEGIGRGCITLQQTTISKLEDTAGSPPPKSKHDEITVKPQLNYSSSADLSAVGGPRETIILGAKDPKVEDHEAGFKFQLELSSVGAAIRKATFSNGLHNGRPSGFDDRNHKNPQPLVLLAPTRDYDGRELLSMAIKKLVLVEQERQFAMDRLSWQSLGVEKANDGAQSASFQAVIEDSNGQPVIKLIQTYKVIPGSYLLDCGVTIENQSSTEQKVRFDVAGPAGLGREDVRIDMRKVVACFKDSKGQIASVRLDKKKLLKAKTIEELQLDRPAANFNFLWAASVNRYFAAILVPLPDEGKEYCDWAAQTIGHYYNPDNDSKADSGDETIGLDLKVAVSTLAPAGQEGNARAYNFQLYLGPKDKSRFDKNDMYRKLGFVQTIDFMGCCCPAWLINPLAFAILAVMKWMYGFIGNYGVVIIILVFLMRLIMHPVTKKSQVAMSKMSKLAPMAEEIRKKYANNKTEMNKQIMALYKEQGASPVMGMLPMFVQMPIWIALWSAVYAGIELRGAAFLPFWITDLSAPDALIRFSTITLPFGWKVNSLNLLPILMGIAFYLQQKLTPSQSASADPKLVQQQKMMMIMIPLMFPLFLYNSPSGVNLYIMASTFAGVIEQHIIRKHIARKEQEEAKGLVSATSKTGGKVKKKKPKPFFKF